MFININNFYSFYGFRILKSSEGGKLLLEWWRIPCDNDGMVGGIFADWLEENIELLIYWNGDSDTIREAVNDAITHLRFCFNSPERNRLV